MRGHCTVMLVSAYRNLRFHQGFTTVGGLFFGEGNPRHQDSRSDDGFEKKNRHTDGLSKTTFLNVLRAVPGESEIQPCGFGCLSKSSGIASYVLFPAVRPHARWRSLSRESLN